MEESIYARNQFDSSGHFDTIPVCGGQTDGRTETDEHKTTANTAPA